MLFLLWHHLGVWQVVYRFETYEKIFKMVDYNWPKKRKPYVLKHFANKFTSYTKRMSLITGDNSFWCRKDKDTYSISWLFNITSFYIDSLSRARYSSEWWYILCLSYILKCNDKTSLVLWNWELDNIAILLKNSKNFCLNFWVRCFYSSKTCKVTVSDTSKKIWNWIVSHINDFRL